jgi:hypothetical protein
MLLVYPLKRRNDSRGPSATIETLLSGSERSKSKMACQEGLELISRCLWASPLSWGGVKWGWVSVMLDKPSIPCCHQHILTVYLDHAETHKVCRYSLGAANRPVLA